MDWSYLIQQKFGRLIKKYSYKILALCSIFKHFNIISSNCYNKIYLYLTNNGTYNTYDEGHEGSVGVMLTLVTEIILLS